MNPILDSPSVSAKEMQQLYDEIGQGYRGYRQQDDRLANALRRTLGDVDSIANVGAGVGSYEPSDVFVVAIEPSLEMIKQRPIDAASAIRASATHLPFPDSSFDAALAVLTLHHWDDITSGLKELCRIARKRVVIVTWDSSSQGFWLLKDYFPEILEIDTAIFPSVERIREAIGPVNVEVFEIPHDCTDGFLGAYWRRPSSYLDESIRNSMSTFSKIGDVDRGLGQLREDLQTGKWHEQHGHLLGKDSLDIGYRIIAANVAV